MNAQRPLLVILGPTASGKSVLAITLAEKFGGEILACDSTQIYRHLGIGTGKVPASEQRGIPHHLVDLVDPGEIFTAGDYCRHARNVLQAISLRGRLPILTAGTGLYLRALLEGLADAPTRSEKLRQHLRARASQRGAAHLHRVLARLDPLSARRIAPADTQKVIRAIEIRLLSGEPASTLHVRGRVGLKGYRITKIGLLPPRAALYDRIERRTDEMLAAGWLDEVNSLMEKDLPLSAKPFEFLGYSALKDHLAGKLALEDAANQIRQSTRQYAKRQITWFRREQGVHWFNGFGSDPTIISQAIRLCSHLE